MASQVKRIQFFVLDEADRMIENGHFAELDNIIRLTTRIPE
jgi:ATP-dependent RNA helicase DDX24/MAK5